ncbi:DNA-binding protein [Lachnospiraceae bacterium KM106-2]|nr:DNA-binding protein [Lachnospiraceae bacterium KM106-2]
MANWALINKETFSFIRTVRGITLEFIEEKGKFKKDKFEKWENLESEIYPTVNQAKSIAKYYHVPFAGFYMNKGDIDLKHLPRLINMRSYHEDLVDESAINIAIIELLNERELYIDTCKKTKYKQPLFSNIEMLSDAELLADEIRKRFGLDIEIQYSMESARKFYLYIRELIENRGIFVQAFSGIEVDALRGMAIYDKKLPIIGINDKDYYPGKVFTIFHELVHILNRKSTTCNDFYGSFSSRQEEVFCNAVAGEVLVPRQYLSLTLEEQNIDEFTVQNVEKLANKFSISKEVISRRLLDLSYINKAEYEELVALIKQRFEADKERTKKQRREKGTVIPRNMVRETIDKTSTNLCKMFYRAYDNGVYDKLDLARYMEIDRKHIDKFIGEVSKWQMN